MAPPAIGGLLLNVFVALFFVPVLYTWLAPRAVAATPKVLSNSQH